MWLLKLKALILGEVLTAVGLGAVLAQAATEPPHVADSHTVGIGVLGAAMTIIAFFIKRLLDQVDKRLDKLEARPVPDEARLDRLEARPVVDASRIDKLEARVDAADRERQQLVQQNQERHHAQSERTARLEEQLGTLTDRFPFKP